MTAPADGRVLRGERNREALVDALFDLLEGGAGRPRARDIADRAGLSLRTVFQHFEDLESLYAAMADRQAVRLAPYLSAPDSAGSLATRADALAAQRARLFEKVAPVRRGIAAASASSPAIDRRLDELAHRLRDQVECLFAPELDALDRRRRAVTVAALDVATSWETWDRLRRTQGLGAATAERVVAHLVTAAVAPAAVGHNGGTIKPL